MAELVQGQGGEEQRDRVSNMDGTCAFILSPPLVTMLVCLPPILPAVTRNKREERVICRDVM